ncbi:hypothetical protein Cni_G07804 [Canna indica]|uniref:Homeobox domain-containing protein n=1 Tax=Canna indica TaxID=4628 RepID=A0AAQ3K1S7_9LILI|nr:hypothetical protein Cni_G07804 [Canna indica]
MEVSYDCEGDMLSPKKIKNRLKTPDQVQALEKVYNEHKYPSEALKLQVANQIELSLKQVSRWFFHRRLKDKKLLQNDASGNCKQNISGSLINDHNSGVEQESCSSSKQGDLHVDPKDVESKWSRGYHPSTVASFQQKARHGRVPGSICSNTRPHVRSSLWQGEIQQDKIPGSGNISKHFFRDENHNLIKSSSKSRRLMMNSTDFYKSSNENNVVSSVKRKLGEFYCEEGPPLGVHFDPLPPGAFDSSFTEPCQMGDSFQQNPWKRRKSIRGSEVYGNYIPEMLSNASYPGRDFFTEDLQEPLHPKDVPCLQLNQKASVVKRTNYFEDTCQVENFEEYGSNMFDSNCRRTERCFKYRPKVSQDEDVPNREFLIPANRSTYFLESGDVMLPRRTLKKEKILKKRRSEHSDLVDQQIMNIESRKIKGNVTMSRKQSFVKNSKNISHVRSSFVECEDHRISSSID